MQNLTIQDLNQHINQLYVQVALSTAETSILRNILLDAVADLHPEIADNLYTHYIDAYQDKSNEALQNIQSLVQDQALLIRQKFELHTFVQHLKRDPRYISPDKR